MVQLRSEDSLHTAIRVPSAQKMIEAVFSYDLQIYLRKTIQFTGPNAHTHFFNQIAALCESRSKPKDAAGASQ